MCLVSYGSGASPEYGLSRLDMLVCDGSLAGTSTPILHFLSLSSYITF